MRTLFAALLLMGASAVFADDCCKAKQQPDADAEFMRIAKEMEMNAEGKQACCRSTAEKPVTKGEPGCCNAPSEPKLFKVFVVNQGYTFYGCEDSAAQGRKALIAAGHKVGKVQKTLKA